MPELPHEVEAEKARADQERIALQKKHDYMVVFSESEDGERVLRDLAEFCGFFGDGYADNALRMAHSEGMRAVYLYILRKMEVQPDAEALNEQRRANAVDYSPIG